MTPQAFPDDVLMAYADGELDDQTARWLETAMQTDSALAHRLTLFTGTRDALSASAQAHPPEPLPDALMARVKAVLDEARPADDVIPLVPRAAPASQRQSGWQPMALAASLALVVGLGAGFGASTLLRSGSDDVPLQIALLDTPGLKQALSDLASGETASLPDGTLTVIASFGDADGTFCREFEFDGATGGTVVSVVCREGTSWDTRLAVATSSQDDTTYAPASSLDTLEAYLNAIGASAPFTPEQEARALADLEG